MENQITNPDEEEKVIEREEKQSDVGCFYRLKKCSTNDYKRIMCGAEYLLLVKKLENNHAVFTRVYSTKSKNAITIRVNGKAYWVKNQKIQTISLNKVYRTQLKAEEGMDLSDKVLRGQWKWEEKKKRDKARQEKNYVNIHPDGATKKTPEEPKHVQQGAAHPYSGGGFSPK